MRTFSFRPSLTLRGRKFKGPRGFAGKPFHPPLTDIPVGAYVLAATFDLISSSGISAISGKSGITASFARPVRPV